MEDNRASWANVALTAIPAAVWGSTYAVTQQWLPPGRPLFAATVRALPVGLLMLLWVRRLPRGDWWWRSLVLGSLNIGLFYALLFLAAYRLPSGLGATLVATAPMVTMGVTWLLMGRRPARVAAAAGLTGLLGVALLVLQNGLDKPLDPLGLGAGLVAVVLSSVGFVLTRKWSPTEHVVTMTSWQLVAGGLVLLPIGLVVEPIEVGGHRRGAAVARRVEADHHAGEVIPAVFADLLRRERACRQHAEHLGGGRAPGADHEGVRRLGR